MGDLDEVFDPMLICWGKSDEQVIKSKFFCSELSSNPQSTCGPSSARQLEEILHITGCHDEVVLASAFSPHDLTLVTGCHSGKVIWNQPVL